MTDPTLFDIERGSFHERSNYPRAKPSEKLTGGVPFDNIIGAFPWDPDDGFDEAIRELRSGRWPEVTK